MIGILAFQGNIAEHKAVLQALDEPAIEVRTLQDLAQVEHLIIPGGESTVLSRFLKMEKLDAEIKKRGGEGLLAVFGTCAGAILLSTNITGGKGAEPLGLIDIDTDRNAYGTQIDSFETALAVKGMTKPVNASFIRAPLITRVGKGVEVLATHQNHPVIVRQGRILASSCHPEMRGETAIHRLFLGM
jgi:5'-phosphate synthase pdxT subunit